MDDGPTAPPRAALVYRIVAGRPHAGEAARHLLYNRGKVPMRSDPSDVALRNLRRLVEQDPILRDIVHPTLPSARRQARYQPAVDVLENATGWTLILDVPGVAREALSVRLDGTRLTIRGDRTIDRGGARVRVGERETGPFVREFLVPFAVRADAIAARLENGVLTVVLPRSGPERAQDIPVE